MIIAVIFRTVLFNSLYSKAIIFIVALDVLPFLLYWIREVITVFCVPTCVLN